MDGGQPEPLAELVAGRRLGRRLVDDPDLDDALGPGPLEEPRDLRPGDAEQLGDARLRLAELVVEPARLDQLLDVGHGAPDARTRRARGGVHICTIQMCGG